MSFRNSVRLFSVWVAAALVLNGCSPAILLGGGTASVVASDERSAGSFVEDQEIELKASFRISDGLGRQVNVSVTSYNRRVLLTGQVPTEEMRQQVIEIIEGIDNVREVLDRLEVSGLSSLTARASDSTLTAKAKTSLCTLQQQDFSCLDVKVVTEQGVVYLLGLVNERQAEIAVETVRKISGVIRVVKVFEYI